MSEVKNANILLITGADGALGSYFYDGLKFSIDTLDVTNLTQVREVLNREHPQTIIHLAAITDMALCEKDPNLAYRVNSIGTYHIALVARNIGAKVVYVSSNAVFDGKKKGPYSVKDTPYPVNIYGHSKYLGELAVLGMNARNLVVRSSWIFGGGVERDKKLVGKVIAKLFVGESVQGVEDVEGTPTYGKDLVGKLKQLVKDNISGVVHAVNGGKASRFDMIEVMKGVLHATSEIKKVPLSSFPNIGNTLKNETLDAGVHTLRSWQEALKEYVETEWKHTIKN